MEINRRFTRKVLESMRRDVEEAGGNEVFWAGTINENGIITHVETGSRGNIDSVVINREVAREGHVLIHNHPSGILSPSDADQAVAANAGDTSLGFYIVNNDLTDLYVVVEPVKVKVQVLLKADEVSDFLSSTGSLAKNNPAYEERPSQIELLKQIAKSFNEGKVGVFEAGTGVGKSYAYLIPSMLWAMKNKERVVLSTGTINLQQQLFEKDIPAAKKITGLKSLKAVLVKGRQNYVCLRRLEDASTERELFSEDTETLDKIYSWAKSSPTGSRSDLAFMPADSLWTRVNSESDACMGMRCPHRENCFVMKVRKEASDANLLVVNHHLLFADIESRMNGVGYEDAAVLPPYRRIVFDEAHGIEDSATSFFSESFTRLKINKQLNLLYRTYKGSLAGFLVQVASLANTDGLIGKASGGVSAIKEILLDLDLQSQIELDNSSNARVHEENFEKFSKTLNCIKKLHEALGKFTGELGEIIENLSDDDLDMPCVWESKTILRRLEDFAILCKNFYSWNEHPDTVFWLQAQRLPAKKKGEEALVYTQFSATPLDIAPLMNSGVFEPMTSVVCTSATIRTGTSFRYWERRTGISFLEEDRLLSGVFDSPFPYKQAAIFAVPRDAPFPDSPDFQSYVEDTLPRLILAAKGRTLVLFTSYESLKNACNATFDILNSNGITLLRQGDDDRFRLLERFRNDRCSVLYATDSFWEGVDVPGDSLSQVIIVKLPFAVPNDPVFAARAEAVEKRGGSPFMELSVPQAVIKFRQGFGRLIRRGDDRGVIIVLDRRIVEKRYGKEFTNSVPMTRRMYNPLKDIIKAVENFLG